MACLLVGWGGSEKARTVRVRAAGVKRPRSPTFERDRRIDGVEHRMQELEDLVLHADEALVVARKPAGWLAVPGRGEDKADCLFARLSQRWPDLRVVHRLDMATSGLMLFAQGLAVQRQLSRAFEQREVAKRYVAVVCGLVAEESGRIELPRASWLETSGYLEHRAEMAIRALIRDNDPKADLSRADKVWFQTWIARNADLINKDGVFPFLNATKREIAQSGHVKIDEVFPQHRFLIVRARPDHPDAWLTNRLIADFVPSDFVARYVFSKQTFYKDYESWSEPWRAQVVDVLKSTYLKEKQAFRARLYGLTD